MTVFVDRNINLSGSEMQFLLSITRSNGNSVFKFLPVRCVFLVCHGFAFCLLPHTFTYSLFVLLESPCTFFEEITQSAEYDRGREIAVKPVVSACAEAIEEQHKFVCFQVIKLGNDNLCCLGKLMSVCLSLQSFKVAKLVKLWYKPRFGRRFAVTGI